MGRPNYHGHLREFAKVGPTVGSSLGHSLADGRAHLCLPVLAAKVGNTETTIVGPTMVTKPWSPEKGQWWPDGRTLAADRNSHPGVGIARVGPSGHGWPYSGNQGLMTIVSIVSIV